MHPDQLRVLWRQDLKGSGATIETRAPLVETLLVQMRQRDVASVIIHDDRHLVQLVEGPRDVVEELIRAAAASSWRDDPQVLERRPLAMPALISTCRVAHAATAHECRWLASELNASVQGLGERIVDWAVEIAWATHAESCPPHRLN